ncbi:MAG TPA: symmetrical bis(5'-nucleosyl)-tetraphosphatase, partial [Chromatiales bacterium]|nr:symmetrical bis(5'-nucleosyl)-tetraphosphatase [Chromatiales bacterium]HEX23187.1 symmetrical bis(5'-nucleosyl)-tetraphosphatase [Chromatiales bacterium]
MAIYAIGDIQGCFDELQALLAMCRFDPAVDRLWFTGDLVNRGPDSLKVLRFVRGLGEGAITVLGNHDLHLLAVAEGLGKLHKPDTLQAILDAPDRDELLHWLRQQPLLYHDADLNAALVHAGLPPQWDLREARAYSVEVETVLRGDDYREFFTHMYGDKPRRWAMGLTGWDRLRFIVNCFTRLRFCRADGELCLKAKGEPGTQPAGCVPWFQAPGRRSTQTQIIFGHWSTLG